jgi:DNA-binding MarR family transcriptional regulator
VPTERYLKTLRALAECFQAFERHSARHLRTLGLTPPQFDIIATLGNTPGMTFRELGDRTLITKGTLTGVVDRLAAKRLVERVPSPADGRSTIVRLTRRGEAEFRRVYPAHVAYLKPAFAGMADLDRLEALLEALRGRLAAREGE